MADFTPLNRLEELLVRAARDPATRPEFMRELLASEVVLLQSAAGVHPGLIRREVGDEVSLTQFPGPSGPYTPMFSARERVEEVASRMGTRFGFVAMRGSDAFGLLAQHPDEATLNPGFPYGKVFTPSEIRSLAAGILSEPPRFAPPGDALLRAPVVYPQRLVDELVEAFRRQRSVEAAFLAELQISGDTAPPHPVIGIASSDYARVFEAVGSIAERAVGNAYPVDFIPMAVAHPITAYLRQTRPFYERAPRRAWWSWST